MNSLLRLAPVIEVFSASSFSRVKLIFNTEYNLPGRESVIILKPFPRQKIIFSGTYLK